MSYTKPLEVTLFIISEEIPVKAAYTKNDVSDSRKVISYGGLGTVNFWFISERVSHECQKV